MRIQGKVQAVTHSKSEDGEFVVLTVVCPAGTSLEPKTAVVLSNESAPSIPGASLAEVERHAIETTYKAAGCSSVAAAKILDISPRTMQYRVNQWGLRARKEKADTSSAPSNSERGKE